MDNQAQLHATEDAALRSGVAFWAVDARGLVAMAPMGNATQGSPGGQSMYTGGAATALTSSFQLSQDTMYSLAGDTGGKALLDNNDLEQGIVNAQHSESNYYILGYYSSNTVKNGKFRKVKVTVGPPQEDAKLDYRVGYWADKEWGKFNTADKERQLEDALMQGDPWTDLTVALETQLFPVEPRGILRSGGSEDSRTRAGAGEEARRGIHDDRLRRRDQGRLRRDDRLQ